jgi:hypothetical protein
MQESEKRGMEVSAIERHGMETERSTPATLFFCGSELMQIRTYGRDQGDHLLECLILVVDDMDLEPSLLKGLLGLLDGITAGEVAVLGVGEGIELRLIGQEGLPGDILKGALGALDGGGSRDRHGGGRHGWVEDFASEGGCGSGGRGAGGKSAN